MRRKTRMSTGIAGVLVVLGVLMALGLLVAMFFG